MRVMRFNFNSMVTAHDQLLNHLEPSRGAAAGRLIPGLLSG
jgi:hypothetical protein